MKGEASCMKRVRMNDEREHNIVIIGSSSTSIIVIFNSGSTTSTQRSTCMHLHESTFVVVMSRPQHEPDAAGCGAAFRVNVHEKLY